MLRHFFVVVLHMTPYKISEKFEAVWLGGNVTGLFSWWRHQMETFSALLVICAGNSPVPGEFPTQRPVTRSFDVYFDLSPNKRLSKQLWGWWFETQSRPLWRHRNVEMGLMQQATHPMWYYVRGKLRNQAAFTHSIENSVMLNESRHICTNEWVIRIYMFWKPHIDEMRPLRTMTI